MKSWHGNLLAYEIAADGIRIDYTYDALGRRISSTRSPLPLGEGQGEGMSPYVVTYAYDAEGRTLSSTISSGGLSQTSTNAYDGAGRLVWARSSDGVETAYDYGFTAAGLPYTSTIKSPSPLLCASAPLREALSTTNTTVRHKDGQVAYTEFNGVRKTTYAYGFDASNPGIQWTYTYEAPLAENSPAWTCSISDALGRTIEERRPGFGGSVLVTSNSFNTAGQLLASTQYSQVNLENPVILSKNLYSYDAIGEAVVSAQDIDLDGQIDFAGPDVVSSNATAYVTIAEGGTSAWWRESRQYAFPETGSASPLLVSTSRQRLSGLGGTTSTVIGSAMLVSESLSIDALGNTSNRKSYLNRDTHATASVTTSPASTLPSYSISVGGLSLTNCTSSGIVSSREYDALGRAIASTDGRGNTTTVSYDAQGRVAYSEDALGNRTTLAYDALGRQVTVTSALGEATYTAYDAENRVISTWGATYPVAYAYDVFGRMTAMNTFRDEAMQNGDTTTWLYDDATGLLTNKVYSDGKGPSYTYTSDGKLATRTWARGLTTTYAYNAAGLLTGILYGQAVAPAPSTPDVAFTYDRLGRQLSAIAAGVSTNLYAYSRLGQLTNEVVSGGATLSQLAEISRTYDSLGRSTGYALEEGGATLSQLAAVSYGYDTYGRFTSVASTNFQFSILNSQFEYSYLPGSSLVSGMTASTGHAWARSYEPNRNLISAVENTFGETVISRFDYANDEIGRRVSRADSGQAFPNPGFDKYAYNTRSEVIGAQRYHGTDVSDTSRVYGGREFGYNYDPIGNRTTASETIGGETLVKTYAANELNQYTAIANPDAVGLRGDATNTAVVTVNGNAASRDTVASDIRPWHFALPADNANGPEYTFASIVGVVNPAGTNDADIVSTTSGSVYAPPQKETLTYDDDGNLLSDGRWHYTWNGENRLVCAEEQVCPTNRTLRKVDYAYDHQGRMVWKEIKHRDAEAQSWEEEKTISYLWDDFNIIAETSVADSATNTTYNIWGLDLDGTMQGAGGVGGLLAVISPLPLGEGSTVYLPCYDANGNIMEYVSTDGTIAANREYDPFGGTVVATGDANAFTHWFSTKPWCSVTGLSEYQYRKYDPLMGRWLNRDPIGEEGGKSIYAYSLNSSIQLFDRFGNIPIDNIENLGGVSDDFFENELRERGESVSASTLGGAKVSFWGSTDEAFCTENHKCSKIFIKEKTTLSGYVIWRNSAMGLGYKNIYDIHGNVVERIPYVEVILPSGRSAKEHEMLHVENARYSAKKYDDEMIRLADGVCRKSECTRAKGSYLNALFLYVLELQATADWALEVADQSGSPIEMQENYVKSQAELEKRNLILQQKKIDITTQCSVGQQ